MDDEINKHSTELMSALIQGVIGIATIQGVELGFFDWIPAGKPITSRELAGQLGYDIGRVERWLRFAAAYGLIDETDGGYRLNAKGALLRRGTPLPDLLGQHHLFGYFARAVQNSKEAYQKGTGLDSVSRGRISREHLPRIASHLLKAASEFFTWSGLSPGNTVLDLSCGDGSVLRETVLKCPGISATGIDISVHTLEQGKRKNAELGLQDQIDLQTGDLTDLSRFRDNAFDWVYGINVFHFLPVNKRESVLKDMIRISRYGIFFNQVIMKSIQTMTVDVLMATLFSDHTGYFTESEADAVIKSAGNRHYACSPDLQDESRLVCMYTIRNDIPLSRIHGIESAERSTLESMHVQTAKDALTADMSALTQQGLDAEKIRKAVIRTLFP